MEAPLLGYVQPPGIKSESFGGAPGFTVMQNVPASLMGSKEYEPSVAVSLLAMTGSLHPP